MGMQGLAEPHLVIGRWGDQSETGADLAAFVPAQPFQQAMLRICMLDVCFTLRNIAQQHISPAIPEEQPIFHLKYP